MESHTCDLEIENDIMRKRQRTLEVVFPGSDTEEKCTSPTTNSDALWIPMLPPNLFELLERLSAQDQNNLCKFYSLQILASNLINVRLSESDRVKPYKESLVVDKSDQLQSDASIPSSETESNDTDNSGCAIVNDMSSETITMSGLSAELKKFDGWKSFKDKNWSKMQSKHTVLLLFIAALLNVNQPADKKLTENVYQLLKSFNSSQSELSWDFMDIDGATLSELYKVFNSENVSVNSDPIVPQATSNIKFNSIEEAFRQLESVSGANILGEVVDHSNVELSKNVMKADCTSSQADDDILNMTKDMFLTSVGCFNNINCDKQDIETPQIVDASTFKKTVTREQLSCPIPKHNVSNDFFIDSDTSTRVPYSGQSSLNSDETSPHFNPPTFDANALIQIQQSFLNRVNKVENDEKKTTTLQNSLISSFSMPMQTRRQSAGNLKEVSTKSLLKTGSRRRILTNFSNLCMGCATKLSSSALVRCTECYRQFCTHCSQRQNSQKHSNTHLQSFDHAQQKCAVCAFQSQQRPKCSVDEWHSEFHTSEDLRFVHELRDSLPYLPGLFIEIHSSRPPCWRHKFGSRRGNFSFKFYGGIYEARLEALLRSRHVDFTNSNYLS